MHNQSLIPITKPSIFLIIALLAQAGVAEAAPIVFDMNEAIAESRRDPGTGVCGSAIKFVNHPSAIQMAEAIALLDKPASDSNIVSRSSRLFQNMNFSVGAGSEGDFRTPGYSDDILPHCQDPNASPPGADDNNLALRLRGYLNVTNTNGGQPITIVLHCDDGCALRIGRTRQLVVEADDASLTLTGRRARWVSFQHPGLYPVELVYYQNSSMGIVEWSQAPTAVFGSDDLAVGNVAWAQNAGQFRPVAGTDLYSAAVGSNATCAECGAPGQPCAAESFCATGLCQACNVTDHCGASCTACSVERPICSAGKCVQCTSDLQCPVGNFCELTSGSCMPPIPCTSDAQCPMFKVCRDGYCGNVPEVCRIDSECVAGEICSCEDLGTSCQQKICIRPPPPCLTDSDCNPDQSCAPATRLCGAKASGCGTATGTRTQPDAWPMSLALLAALSVLLRRRTAGSNYATNRYR